MKKTYLLMMITACLPPATVLAENQINTQKHASPVAGQEIETVIVTATKLPRTLSNIAGTISVITAEELEQQMAGDIDDIIRYQPGISLNTAGRGGNQGFIIRGIGGNRVLTLIDGVRSSDIYSAGPASYGRDAYEVDDFKSVEVIRGPASVLYGADALGGAVIINTKSPRDYLSNSKDTYFAVRSGFDSANEEGKIGFTAASQLKDWGFVTQYTHRDFNEKDIEGSGELNPQDGDSDALMFKTVWTPNENHQLTVTLDAFDENIDYDLLTDVGRSVTNSTGKDETERYRASINHHWQLGLTAVDHIDNQLYWQKTDATQNTVQHRNSYSFPHAPFGTAAIRKTDFEFNQEIWGIGSTLVKAFNIGNTYHAMVYGLNYEVTDTERPRNRCETDLATGSASCDILAYPFSPAESFPNKTFPDTETTRAGIFWQDEITLGESGFRLIPGIRYDYYDMDANTKGVVDIAGYSVESFDEEDVSVNLGLLYDLTEQVSLFAQYSEGFRPPSFDEANQSFVNLAFGYATVPNPNLKPETSKGYEIGVKADLPEGYVSLAIFDNHYDDFIESQYIGNNAGISLYQQSNISEARIWGVELTSIWQLNNNWQLNGSLAHARGEDEDADRPLDSVDPLTAVIGLAYNASDDQWRVETALTLVDKKDRVSDDSRVTNSGYGITDIFGHYNLSNKVKIRLGVFNVFNKQYAQWANLSGLSATSSSVDRAQESGTTFRAALDITF
ncbi:hypothetical protein A9Q88_02735 [Gammaproteobacteria bacterium 50_400_T64]|nr:hypothetical protein A9Q88_02735 [Gammaproteobacteria bacterium 50_400_T64]